jgi:hypothetical protein
MLPGTHGLESMKKDGAIIKNAALFPIETQQSAKAYAPRKSVTSTSLKER